MFFRLSGKAIPELRSGIAESPRPRSLFVGVLYCGKTEARLGRRA
jgi:hypothetical protein